MKHGCSLEHRRVGAVAVIDVCVFPTVETPVRISRRLYQVEHTALETEE